LTKSSAGQFRPKNPLSSVQGNDHLLASACLEVDNTVCAWMKAEAGLLDFAEMQKCNKFGFLLVVFNDLF
jgi:hypothetical protein